MLLRLKNIGKIYDSNDILTIGIRGINLDFDYNEFVTIEGESGSGKSTLLNVIGANDSYEEGELYEAEKNDGVKTQRVKIVYNCVGTVSVPNADNEPVKTDKTKIIEVA